jgi:hypothetical protein
MKSKITEMIWTILLSHRGGNRMHSAWMPWSTALLVGIALTVGAMDTAASPVTYVFSGSLITAGGSLTFGTPFSGLLTLDLDQPNDADPDFQTYDYTTLSIVVGVETLNVFNGQFFVDNDGSFAGDRVDIEFGSGSVGGLTFTHGRLRLVNFSNTAITWADLPFNTNLDDWDLKELRIFAEGVDIIGNLDEFRIVPSVKVVSIDIKPGSSPNSVNPRSKGKIPVAILSTLDFDATTEVDRDSLTFGRTGNEDSLHRRGPNQVPNCGTEDVDDDDLDDLVCQFITQDTGIACGDTSAFLTGETVDGQWIKGSDSVKTVGCK